ncbi:hypothetical protein GCM10007216_35130 [Thalassobacillus devorans]|uniref:DUF2164 domain-containing protein n=1 Tax=Thalassobacillus devorans TaxID=279813 RepID=A0ABQ1PQV1_9BACI|nr:DUF2164 domain-containing protein [Thalassobacillus devorans]NIK30296.1 uncharacterized protein (DUF2164 family) [Thalassobacillus devorans]GGD01368.1 hypothetical protein GCM10007216_35130 [Thalassobacillus devorans]
MNMVKKITKEEKKQIVSSIQEYFEMERGEEIGSIAAEQLLDFFMKELGPYIYNQGIRDAKGMVEEKVMNLEEDILSLERPVGRKLY